MSGFRLEGSAASADCQRGEQKRRSPTRRNHRPRAEIRIKRIYSLPTRFDGTRILVDGMWPRGVRKGEITVWLKEIAPSRALRSWFGHEPERWEEFRRRYADELGRNLAAVTRIRELVRGGPATLLFAARDEEHNNAVVLADYLRSHPE
jgi:uncharacterized protein YeaO (DUF488 family)